MIFASQERGVFKKVCQDVSLRKAIDAVGLRLFKKTCPAKI